MNGIRCLFVQLIAKSVPIIGALAMALTVGCNTLGKKSKSDQSSLDAASGSNEQVSTIKLGLLNLDDYKVCGDNSYVVGVSQQRAALCVNDGKALRKQNVPYKELVVRYGTWGGNDLTSPRFGTSYDWAAGRRKLECPAGWLVAGLTNISSTDDQGGRHPNLGVVCVSGSGRRLEAKASQCNTVWFDRKSDSRSLDGSSRDADFDPYVVKGQCARGQYIAGVAFYDEWVVNNHKPNALLCCPMQ